MEWRILLQHDVQQFIAFNKDADVRELALKKASDPSWPYALILDQIKVRQKARIKSPNFYETNGILFPPNDTYEQASSDACGIYKASLVEGGSFVDLTSGCGVDSYHISKNFHSAIWVERDDISAALLGYNLDILKSAGKLHCEARCHHGDAEGFLDKYENGDLVFIDPQRRENVRKGIYDLGACSPDVLSLLPILKTKFRKGMVKASPVLDIEKAVLALKCVRRVHVVQWRGECKEVLYELDFTCEGDVGDVNIVAVTLDDAGSVQHKFSFRLADEKNAQISYAMPQSYIYEPDPAYQKSGGFKSFALFYGLEKLHQHTHLYTSREKRADFPGKIYEFMDIKPVKAKGLGIKKADLAVRNFPMNVQDLKKKLKISDGGKQRIYAVTLCNDEKQLIICNKL
ncbi:MAG: THUMP-like domain-containing protein [Alphaproteobacteria bacterium]